MSFIEKIEDKYCEGYNDTGNVIWPVNKREAKWNYAFLHHRDAPPIKYILDEIHAANLPEGQIISDIVSTADFVDTAEKKCVSEIVYSGKYLNKEKHKFILARNLKMPLVFRKEVPKNVTRTATLLGKAYVSSLVDPFLEDK